MIKTNTVIPGDKSYKSVFMIIVFIITHTIISVQCHWIIGGTRYQQERIILSCYQTIYPV